MPLNFPAVTKPLMGDTTEAMTRIITFGGLSISHFSSQLHQACCMDRSLQSRASPPRHVWENNSGFSSENKPKIVGILWRAKNPKVVRLAYGFHNSLSTRVPIGRTQLYPHYSLPLCHNRTSSKHNLTAIQMHYYQRYGLPSVCRYLT